MRQCRQSAWVEWHRRFDQAGEKLHRQSDHRRPEGALLSGRMQPCGKVLDWLDAEGVQPDAEAHLGGGKRPHLTLKRGVFLAASVHPKPKQELAHRMPDFDYRATRAHRFCCDMD